MNAKGKRWFTVILIHALAVLIFWVLYLFYGDAMFAAADWLHRQPLASKLPIIILLSLPLWLFIEKTAKIRPKKDIPNLIRYPSAWLMPVLLASLFIIAVLILALTKYLPFYDGLTSTILTFAAFLLTGGATVYSNNKLGSGKTNPVPKRPVSADRSDQQEKRLHEMPAQDIIAWSQKEQPIDNAQEDFFGHDYTAEKLSEMLAQGQSVALIGHYGSGKTSIIEMMLAKGVKGAIFCRVGGWGLKVSTAVEHILYLVIEELKHHVDCLAISNLPRQYQLAMSSSGNNYLKMLSCCLEGTKEPEKILKRIDSILECLGRRLVIILEDFDRNINDATFFNEIAAFLGIATKLENMSFLIAIGPKEKLSATLSRLCEHSEYIQAIDKDRVGDIYNKLVEDWLNRFADYELLDAKSVTQSLGVPETDGIKPLAFIAKLVDSPRTLKASIRLINHKWEKLAGEINFIEFFLLSILYTAANEAYTFIYNYISDLRNLTGPLSE